MAETTETAAAAAPVPGGSILDPRGWGVRGWTTLAVLLFLAIAPPAAFLLDEPFYLDLAIRLVCLTIAAVSLNLILGYGGMISFGHAAYIGIGAYAVGIPAFHDYLSGWLHFPLAVGVSALFALVTGAICLRTRGVHFIMITLAFAQMAYFLFVSMEAYGGDDGLLIYYRSEFSGVLDIDSNLNLYILCYVVLLAAMYLVHRIVNSRFGMVLRGSKGNDARMRAIGYNTYAYRLAAYVISAAICGLAGALLGNFTNFISPEMMAWSRSGELIFMVILGGAGTVLGPVIGALAFLALEELLSGWTIYWQLIFGLLLILVVLYMKGGIVSILGRRQPEDG
ncbi:MAG: branched-chain amino acid ABC transporter permease [Sneathiellaceae bacterium]